MFSALLGFAYVCNMCSVVRTAYQNMFPHFYPLNQNLARVRTREGGGVMSADFSFEELMYMCVSVRT